MENFLANKTVMVIDDDLICSAVLSEFLEQAGAKVIQTSSGEEGLRLNNQHEVSLIFSSLGLEDIPAVPLVKQLRIQDNQIPIIALTDTHDVTLIAAVMRAGVKDVILKPLTDVAALQSMILETLYPDLFSSDVEESDRFQHEWEHLSASPAESIALLRSLQPPAHSRIAGCNVGYRQLSTTDNSGLVLDIAELSDSEFAFYIFDAVSAGEYGVVTALLLRAFFNDLLQKQLSTQPGKLPGLITVLDDIQSLFKTSGLRGQFPLVIGYFNRERQHLLLVNNGLSCIVHDQKQQHFLSGQAPLGNYYTGKVIEHRLSITRGECEVWNQGRKIWLRFN